MSTVTLTSTLDEAQRLAKASVSVIPVDRNKRPVGSWKAEQNSVATIKQLETRFAHPHAVGLAAVCGAVSGGLMCVDFDLDTKEDALEPVDLERDFIEPWLETISAVIDPGLLPRQRTGGGGFQFFFRCPNPSGNQKLAAVSANNRQGKHITVETRGEGGYALLPPSPHPSGGVYRWEHLELTDVPTLTQEQADFILEAARALDRMPHIDEERLASEYRAREGRDDIISSFNAKHHPSDLLERNGYKGVGAKYLSPDSSSGNPGVTVFKDAPLIYSHHSDLLGNGKAHESFDVFAFLEHGGDKRAAYEAAGRELGLWQEGKTPPLRAEALEDAHPWQDRLELPPTTPAVPTLPKEMIPEPLCDWIDDAAERLCVHRELIAIPVLVSLGAVVGRYYRDSP